MDTSSQNVRILMRNQGLSSGSGYSIKIKLHRNFSDKDPGQAESGSDTHGIPPHTLLLIDQLAIFGGTMRVFIYAVLMADFFLTNCSSSVKTVYVNSELEENKNERSVSSISDSKDLYKNLADFLRNEPRLNITGADDNVAGTVRGVNSFISSR